MLGLIQRVSSAQVTVKEKVIGSIEHGLLVLLGVEANDTKEQAQKLLEKIIGYRIFEDDKGRMNLSLKETEGSILVVSQFTLAADTSKGLRPGFSTAAAPDDAENLYNYFIIQAKKMDIPIETGQFGAYMAVELVNDGPATFILKA